MSMTHEAAMALMAEFAAMPYIARAQYTSRNHVKTVMKLDRIHGLDTYDFGARNYFADRMQWMTMDPLCEKYYDISSYAYCLNNPVNAIDPVGLEPIYNSRGDFLGTTSEGFTGEVLIYDGAEQIDFAKFTKKELFKKYGQLDNFDIRKSMSTLNGGLTHNAMSRIWTHIVSQFNGMKVYDLTFDLSSIEGRKIYYEFIEDGAWQTHFSLDDIFMPTISGSGNQDYETTVENVASSIIVHEWYSHARKKTTDRFKSHRLAYKNVINFKKLWNKTTFNYKQFNLEASQKYTQRETGRKFVDYLYRNLYKRYVGK